LGIEQLTNDGLAKYRDVVTDGARIYFTEHTNTGCVVAQIPTVGGSPVAIARLKGDMFIQDLSPVLSELLMIEATSFGPKPIWVLPLLGGGEPRRLGDIVAYSAAWSPDGSTLAYASDGGLYLSDASGANSRRIVAMAGKLEDVRWSPNGRQLCWRRVSGAEATLWLADRDGKGLRRLAAGWDASNEGVPCTWTPDGRYLILAGHYAGHRTLGVLRASRGPLSRHENLTFLGPTGVDFCSAAASADGSALYCVGQPKVRFQLGRLDSKSKQLMPYLPDLTTTEFDFTNDGGWVAYVDEKGSLWKGRVGGGEKVQLTAPALEGELPRWSPDGKRIAFMGREPGKPWKVRLVSADGGSYNPVTSNDNNEGAPTWSPDGSRLTFGDLVDPATRPPGPLVIHIFDLKKRRLSVVPGSEGLWTARWSPGGRYIAALTEDSRTLVLFDFQTGKWEKLFSLGQILDLHWSRQGKSIYLLATTTKGQSTLFRVKIPGHQAEQLISLEGEHVGNYLGVAPDDTPLVARPVNSGEIYALECQFPK
jgi:Tol biopolymer transport system component